MRLQYDRRLLLCGLVLSLASGCRNTAPSYPQSRWGAPVQTPTPAPYYSQAKPIPGPSSWWGARKQVAAKPQDGGSPQSSSNANPGGDSNTAQKQRIIPEPLPPVQPQRRLDSEDEAVNGKTRSASPFSSLPFPGLRKYSSAKGGQTPKGVQPDLGESRQDPFDDAAAPRTATRPNPTGNQQGTGERTIPGQWGHTSPFDTDPARPDAVLPLPPPARSERAVPMQPERAPHPPGATPDTSFGARDDLEEADDASKGSRLEIPQQWRPLPPAAPLDLTPEEAPSRLDPPAPRPINSTPPRLDSESDGGGPSLGGRSAGLSARLARSRSKRLIPVTEATAISSGHSRATD